MLLAGALAGTPFTCTPTRVWDGDGPIWCAEGPRVRLAGIAARELDGTCLRGHPCPDASGIAARDALVELLGGAKGRSRQGHVLVEAPAMRCVAVGQTYGRIAARCETAAGDDLSEGLVAADVVARW